MTPLFGAQAASFLLQVATVEVLDRKNTGVGFYTRVKVDRTKCSPVTFVLAGAYFEVEGVKDVFGILLWDADGYLDTIEGYTMDGHNPLEGVDLAGLQFTRLVSLG
jgi:hypothetical protein